MAERLSKFESANAEKIQKQVETEECDAFNKEFGVKIDSYDGIKGLDNAEKILSLMTESKLPLLDAYFVANRANILKEGADKVRQDTLNQINGKGHIKATGNTSGELDVASALDPAKLQSYRDIFKDKRGKSYSDEVYKAYHHVLQSGKKTPFSTIVKKYGGK